MITLDQLRAIMPAARLRAVVYLLPLEEAMAEFGIDTPQRQAMFLAQVCHESGALRYVRELATGAAYEGRLDLGNTQPGDGTRFRGRGLIQITGRANYRECSRALFGDDRLLDQPDLLERDSDAARSAAWFWSSRGLNALADAGDFRAVTRRINGGLNGWADRVAAWERAQAALGMSA